MSWLRGHQQNSCRLDSQFYSTSRSKSKYTVFHLPEEVATDEVPSKHLQNHPLLGSSHWLNFNHSHESSASSMRICDPQKGRFRCLPDMFWPLTLVSNVLLVPLKESVNAGGVRWGVWEEESWGGVGRRWRLGWFHSTGRGRTPSSPADHSLGSDTFLIHVRYVCDTCLTHVWYMCDTCLVHVWYMCDTFLIHVWQWCHYIFLPMIDWSTTGAIPTPPIIIRTPIIAIFVTSSTGVDSTMFVWKLNWCETFILKHFKHYTL